MLRYVPLECFHHVFLAGFKDVLNGEWRPSLLKWHQGPGALAGASNAYGNLPFVDHGKETRTCFF